MKKIKLLKAAVLFFTVFAFVNCDDTDPIETILAADVTTVVDVTGEQDRTSFSKTISVNVKESISGLGDITDAKITGASLTLEDNFNQTDMEFNVSITLGIGNNSFTPYTETITLERGDTKELDFTGVINQAGAVLGFIDIFSFLIGPNIDVTLDFSKTDNTAIGDDDFTVTIVKKVQATSEV